MKNIDLNSEILNVCSTRDGWEIDGLWRDENLPVMVAARMAAMVRVYDPDFLVTMSKESSRLGREIGLSRAVGSVSLEGGLITPAIRYARAIKGEIVAIGGVITQTVIKEALSVPYFGDRTVAIVGVIDARDSFAFPGEFPVPIETIVGGQFE